MRKFAIIIPAAVIAAAGCCMALASNTLGSLVVLCVAVAVLTAVCGMFMNGLWQRLTLTPKRWINMGVNALVMFPVIMCAVLSINYFGADSESLHTENAVVQRVYSKTRHHTKRVSRRTVTTGETYKVYYAEVSIADIPRKEISLNLKQWRRLHKGDTIKLNVVRGALGMPVIKRTGVPVEVPRSRYLLARITAKTLQ